MMTAMAFLFNQLLFRLMRIQRKMYEANKALSYFVTHNWDFKNDNFINLCTYLKPEDFRSFDYRPYFTSDVINYSRVILYGFRRFLMNEKDENIEEDRKRFQKIEIAVSILKVMLFTGLFLLMFLKFNGNYFFGC
jgi:hypothetical protein